MINLVSDPVSVLEFCQPRTFDGNDGATHLYYSVYVKDGIFPVRLNCSEEAYKQLQKVGEGVNTSLLLSLSFYQGKPKIKIVGVA